MVATTRKPLVEVGKFACLRVKDMSPHGAYLDMGLPKDLLVPGKFQKYPMEVGQVHLVYVLKDEKTGQIYGTQKFAAFLDTKPRDLKPLQEVSMVPYHRTPLGFKVLIENQYLGMVYHNEIFHPVTIGEEYRGCVKKVKDDGQVDGLLKKVGMASILDANKLVLDALDKNGGLLPLGDRSSPEEIKAQLGMSKKSFKNAIGNLYRQKLIQLQDKAIVRI
jgi:predicted RNA-binding protein (virulence factor B family)